MAYDQTAADALREVEVLKAQVEQLRAKVAELEPMDMALCERHSLVLRVGVPYVFRPVDGCKSCAALVAQAREAYGDDLGS